MYRPKGFFNRKLNFGKKSKLVLNEKRNLVSNIRKVVSLTPRFLTWEQDSLMVQTF